MTGIVYGVGVGPGVGSAVEPEHGMNEKGTP